MEEDKKLRDASDDVDNHFKSLILKPVLDLEGVLRRSWDNFLHHHIEKGCYEDPYQINYPIDPSNIYSDLHRGRGTSDGECCNKISTSKLCPDIVKMTTELSHKKVWLRAMQFNLDLDRKLNKVLGIKSPLSIDWWLHDSLVEKCNLFSHCTKLHFPSFLSKDYNDPIIGIGYERYNEMEQIQQTIHEIFELSQIQSQLYHYSDSDDDASLGIHYLHYNNDNDDDDDLPDLVNKICDLFCY